MITGKVISLSGLWPACFIMQVSLPKGNKRVFVPVSLISQQAINNNGPVAISGTGKEYNRIIGGGYVCRSVNYREYQYSERKLKSY